MEVTLKFSNKAIWLLLVLSSICFSQVLQVEHTGEGIVAEINSLGALTVSGEMTENDYISNAGDLLWERSNGETYDSKLVFTSNAVKVKSTIVPNNITDAETGNLMVDVSLDSNLPTAHLDGNGEFDGTLYLQGNAIDGGIPYAAVAYLDRDVFEMNNETNGFENQYASINPEVRVNSDASPYFHINDHLGSARIVLDGEFNIAEATAYHAYGKMERIQLAPEKIRQNFTEKEFDDDGGLAVVAIDVAFTNVDGINALTNANLIVTGSQNEDYTIALNKIGNTVSSSTELVCSNELELTSVTLRVENVTNEIMYILDLRSTLSVDDRTVSVGEKFIISANCNIAALPQVPNQQIPFTDISDPRLLDKAEGETGEFFAGIGQFYFGARYYDAEVGLWTATDPMDEFWNPYSYCGGNPIIYTDPDGMEVDESVYGENSNLTQASYAAEGNWALSAKIEAMVTNPDIIYSDADFAGMSDPGYGKYLLTVMPYEDYGISMMQNLTENLDMGADVLTLVAPPAGAVVKPWTSGLNLSFKAIGHIYDASQGQFSLGKAGLDVAGVAAGKFTGAIYAPYGNAGARVSTGLGLMEKGVSASIKHQIGKQ